MAVTYPARNLLTSAEAGAILRTVPENVRRMARTGALPVACVVGRGQRLFDREDVERVAHERVARRPDAPEAA